MDDAVMDVLDDDLVVCWLAFQISNVSVGGGAENVTTFTIEQSCSGLGWLRAYDEALRDRPDLRSSEYLRLERMSRKDGGQIHADRGDCERDRGKAPGLHTTETCTTFTLVVAIATTSSTSPSRHS